MDDSLSPVPAGAAREQLEATRARLRARPEPPFRALRDGLEVSFEFFPPASEKARAPFEACVQALAPLSPDFVSVTYGAGGSTRARTLEAARGIVRDTGLPVAGHLTCVGATRDEVHEVLDAYAAAGVRRVVALRGDAPEGADRYTPHPEGFPGSVELIEAIARRGDFDISVGCYPEVHPEAASAASDLDHLKRKVDAGASRAITQFFFDADAFLRFVDRARAAGVGVPIVPGILPVTSYASVARFAARCGASVPRWMADLFEPLERAPELRPLVAATVCAELCTRLRDHGVNRFHFYTLNKPQLTASVCHVLGLRAAGAAPAQAVSR